MRRPLYFLTLFALFVGYGVMPGRASSHREAPLISNDPQADNTDVYAFVSPDDPDTVTLSSPRTSRSKIRPGGPNFYRFGDSVLYEIKIDNNGDAVEDISYQFRFTIADHQPEHVPLQHRPDPRPRRPEPQHVSDLHAYRASRTAARCFTSGPMLHHV